MNDWFQTPRKDSRSPFRARRPREFRSLVPHRSKASGAGIKKILLTFLVFLLLFTSTSVPFAYAQDTNPWYMQTFDQWYVKVYDTTVSPPQEIFGERYTAAQVSWVIYGLIAFFLNSNTMTKVGTCIFKRGDVNSCINETPLFGYNLHSPSENKGLFATLFPEGRSLSGVNYIRGKLTHLNLIPQAQAQGLGFNALAPVQKVWIAIRDIMYGFFVLIIIVFAFMIMFRTKISPQTVVTVQSALPKIIITLILVTFSYAIAGFLIDMMYVVVGILAFVFTKTGLFQNSNWSDVFTVLTMGPRDPGANGIIGWFLLFFGPFIAAIFGVAWSIIHLNVAYGAIAYILSIFIIVGVLIWLIITLVKVFILLIKTYISILISVIFAPFIIGFGAILPTGGFSSWLKGLISNLAVYPIIGAFLMLAVVFLSSTYPAVKNSIQGGLNIGTVNDPFDRANISEYWYPPLTLGRQSGNWDPLPILFTFASLGILAMIPKVTDIIKALMTGKGVEGLGGLDALSLGLGYAAGAGKGLIVGPAQREIGYRAGQLGWKRGGWLGGAVTGWAERRGYIEIGRPSPAGKAATRRPGQP